MGYNRDLEDHEQRILERPLLSPSAIQPLLMQHENSVDFAAAVPVITQDLRDT